MANVFPVRSLHWVLKIADRTCTVSLLEKLGFVTLRHEEFYDGCDAACNGPYNGRWSKTMMGYADESSSFVLELTYNYEVASYKRGNDLARIVLHSHQAYQHLHPKTPATAAAAAAPASAGAATDAASAPTATEASSPSPQELQPTPGITLHPGISSDTCNAADASGCSSNSGMAAVTAALPDGYMLLVHDAPAGSAGRISEVALHVTDVQASKRYWSGFLGMHVLEETGEQLLLTYGEGQAQLRLLQLPEGTPLDHADAFGRIAFECPGSQLMQLQADVLAAGYSVLTPYISLDTPGKAAVQVVILADPDGYEICFVGQEGFAALSARDPQASELLHKSIEEDTSRMKPRRIRESLIVLDHE